MLAFGLTPKLAKLLSFITSEIQDHGQPPIFDEMAAHMGLASRSGVHRLLTELEARGRIERSPRLARGIAIPSVCPCCGKPR